jgi:hypothetical protein
MSITVQLDLPDALANEAQASGLLEPQSMKDLISMELRRRKVASDLEGVLGRIRAQPGESMSIEEIQKEVEAVRARKRALEAGR